MLLRCGRRVLQGVEGAKADVMTTGLDVLADQVLDPIDASTRNIHPSLRAQFIGYAAIDTAT